MLRKTSIRKSNCLYIFFTELTLIVSICTTPITKSKLVESTSLCIPNIVMLGFSFPSLLNRDSVATRARGSLGLGSLGEPSTRDHDPRMQSQPMMLCKTQLCSCGKQ